MKNFKSNHQTNKEHTTTYFQSHKKYTKENTMIVQYYTKNTKTKTLHDTQQTRTKRKSKQGTCTKSNATKN